MINCFVLVAVSLLQGHSPSRKLDLAGVAGLTVPMGYEVTALDAKGLMKSRIWTANATDSKAAVTIIVQPEADDPTADLKKYFIGLRKKMAEYRTAGVSIKPTMDEEVPGSMRSIALQGKRAIVAEFRPVKVEAHNVRVRRELFAFNKAHLITIRVVKYCPSGSMNAATKEVEATLKTFNDAIRLK